MVLKIRTYQSETWFSSQSRMGTKEETRRKGRAREGNVIMLDCFVQWKRENIENERRSWPNED